MKYYKQFFLVMQGLFLLLAIVFLAMHDQEMAITTLVVHGGVLFAKGCVENSMEAK